MSQEPAGPLRGLTAIDLSTFIAGPYLAALLADFGANVIKVDHPSGRLQAQKYRAEGEIPMRPKLLNRGKTCITLDLHHPTAKKLLLKLVRRADILVENFRPGVMENWGLGWDTLSRENEGLIMVRISGFGQDGPYAQRPAFGAIAEAMSGFAYIVGEAERPPTLPSFALADSVAALFGAYSAVSAVYERDVGGSGKGQQIDVSLLESVFSILGEIAINYDQKGLVQERSGNRSDFFGAPRNLYQTKDGHWVAVSAGTGIHRRVFRVVGGDEMADDPRFDTHEGRLRHSEEIDRKLKDWIGQRTREEVTKAFEEHDAPLGGVFSIEDIFNDPHYTARGSIASVPDEDLGTVRMQNVAPRLSRTPGAIRAAGHLPGDDNAWFFKEHLGLSDEEIAAAEAEGAI